MPHLLFSATIYPRSTVPEPRNLGRTEISDSVLILNRCIPGSLETLRRFSQILFDSPDRKPIRASDLKCVCFWAQFFFLMTTVPAELPGTALEVIPQERAQPAVRTGGIQFNDRFNRSMLSPLSFFYPSRGFSARAARAFPRNSRGEIEACAIGRSAPAWLLLAGVGDSADERTRTRRLGRDDSDKMTQMTELRRHDSDERPRDSDERTLSRKMARPPWHRRRLGPTHPRFQTLRFRVRPCAFGRVQGGPEPPGTCTRGMRANCPASAHGARLSIFLPGPATGEPDLRPAEPLGESFGIFQRELSVRFTRVHSSRTRRLSTSVLPRFGVLELV